MSIKQKFLKLIGHRFDSRFTWGELSWHPKFPQLALEYCPAGMFTHNTLIVKPFILSLYLHLPTKIHGDGCMIDREPAYGFYTIDQSIVFRWGKFYKSWQFPFVSLNWERTQVLDNDAGKVLWEESVESKKIDKEVGVDWFKRHDEKEEIINTVAQTYDYQYVLKSGKIQKRKATIWVERMIWGRKWAPFLKYVKTYVDVKFNEEVGERTGSWKGGCLQCSTELKRGESPLSALKRMEKERRFK